MTLPLRVLLIGEAQSPELRKAREVLARDARVELLSMANAGRKTPNLTWPPELIVLAVSRPGELAELEVDSLRRAWPLARVVALLGSWCEGETRTGAVWPGIRRLYSHQWEAWLDRNLAIERAGACPEWGLPATATEEERLLAVGAPIGSRDRESQSIGLLPAVEVHADTAIREILTAACQQSGFEVWDGQRLDMPPIAAIVDLKLPTSERLEAIVQIARRFRPGAVAVLTSFPRAELRDKLRVAAAATVFSKPVMLVDVCDWLRVVAATLQD